jgi:hypothetical protein
MVGKGRLILGYLIIAGKTAEFVQKQTSPSFEKR